MRRLIAAVAAMSITSFANAQADEWHWDIAVGGVDTVFMEEMTAGEVAEAIRSGKTTAIIPSGGLEQNGTHLVTGKHNYVVRLMADAIARKLGDTLVTSTVKFVPQGAHNPPSDQMKYSGTISLSPATYQAVLSDIARSLKAHGFTEIILIGDSGGGQQESMANVADKLRKEWAGSGVRVRHIPEFYTKDKNAGEYLVKELNIKQEPITNLHTDYRYEAVMAVADPKTIRAEQRLVENDFTTRGVDMGSVEELQRNGRKLIDYRSDMIAKIIREQR